MLESTTTTVTSSMQLPTSTSTSSASNFRRPSLSAFRYPTAPETTVHTAASFGISFEAALADTDAQLAPRRSSYVSESEVDRRE
ncbi:unnamed protein product [Aureobasidium pullulans]|nr:unnamed protein product [Aureobasidium pullulans]